MSEIVTEATVLASWSAVAAITYVTWPEVWPGFAAWAEQELPGTTWTKDDRAGFEWVRDFFVAVARRLDKEDDDGDRG